MPGGRCRMRLRLSRASYLWLAGLAVVLSMPLAVLTAALRNTNEGDPMSQLDDISSAVGAQDLAAVARNRIFFGHQSVGMNVLDAIPGVYSRHHVPAPPIVQDGVAPGPNGGF